jgi:hypothetical protein
MTRLRRIGLAVVFSITLAGGVLVAQPAQAFTLAAAHCARLASAIASLDDVAAKYPDNKFIAFLLHELQDAYQRYCS